MSQFSPREVKTAILPITAKPAGMACEAELFLGPDDLTKIATSGRVPFVSTITAQSVRLPITMPSDEGTYHGYIDIFTKGIRFLAYKSKEDVVIEAIDRITRITLVPGASESMGMGLVLLRSGVVVWGFPDPILYPGATFASFNLIEGTPWNFSPNARGTPPGVGADTLEVTLTGTQYHHSLAIEMESGRSLSFELPTQPAWPMTGVFKYTL